MKFKIYLSSSSKCSIKTIVIFTQGLEQQYFSIMGRWILLKVLESQEQVLYLYEIPLKVNVSGFIFSNVAGLSSSKFIEK